MKEKIFHPKLQLLVRIVLGGILVYASWHKIADPPDFAKIIYNYSLFPEASLHTFAVFVPWLELVAGLALISGIGLRGGALMAAIFFSFFIVALSYNLARECATICGCFDTHASGKELSDAEKFSKMRSEIALDCSLVIAALYVLFGTFGCCRAGACDEDPGDAPASSESSPAEEPTS